MSKIQKRISTSSLPGYHKRHPKQEYSFVLKDGKVHLVKIESIKDSFFKVRNSMSHRMKIHLQDIQEIWVDERLK